MGTKVQDLNVPEIVVMIAAFEKTANDLDALNEVNQAAGRLHVSVTSPQLPRSM